MKSDNQLKYTSTIAKLLHNPNKLYQIKNQIFLPQSLQIAPTDKCNLNCDFCSVKQRQGNQINIKDIQEILIKFRILAKTQTVELTGGGDPTMYKNINQTIQMAKQMGYQIGLITNGIKLKDNITLQNIKKLKWLRVSLNCLDYVDEINLDGINQNVKLGLSYVWNDKSDKQKIQKVKYYADKYNVKFVRIVPNCLSVQTINKSKQQINNIIKNDQKFFIQQKQYNVPKRCRIGYLKPFLNSDGYLYHCSAIPLIKRKFTQQFRICHWKDIDFDKWSKGQWFDTSNCQQGKCFFKQHNELIQTLTLNIQDEKFI